MSLPSELREQLLSGYLDDALTVDERTRADELLASDADFAAELNELREIRATLQMIGDAGSDAKLADGFADRVLDAAVARAQSEGLGEDHPLLRLAEQPSLASRRRAFDWRIPASVVTLAASIAVAIVVFNRDDEPNRVAQENDPVVVPNPDNVTETTDPSMLAVEPNVQVPGNADDATDVEVGDPQLDGSTDNGMVADGRQDSNVPNMIPEATDTPDVVPPVQPSQDDAIAATDTKDPAARIGELSPENQLLLGGSPVMVYSVQVSEIGKLNKAVESAMAKAQIGATRQKKVSDDIAGFVAKPIVDPEKVANARVLYLQAPLKSLDRFYLNLLADEEGIAKVGIGIAFNTPIERVTDMLRVDPTWVKHEGRVLELVSSTPVVTQLASELDQLQFNYKREASMMKIQDDGPDEMGQVLVLILP